MALVSRRNFARLVASMSLTVVCGTGCNSLDFNRHTSALNSAPPVANQVQQASAQEARKCAVEIHAEGQKPKRIAVNLEDQTHVQELLDKSGATKQFRRMNVELYRRTPTGKTHKMAVNYSTKDHKVEPQNDYFIQPDDVLVVTEDTSTIVDDMLKRVGGVVPMIGGSGK